MVQRFLLAFILTGAYFLVFFSCTTRRVYYGNVKIKQEPAQEVILDGGQVTQTRYSKQDLKKQKSLIKEEIKRQFEERDKLLVNLIDERIAEKLTTYQPDPSLFEKQHARLRHSHPDFNRLLQQHLESYHKQPSAVQKELESRIHRQIESRLKQVPAKEHAHPHTHPPTENFNRLIEERVDSILNQRLAGLTSRNGEAKISEQLHRHWHRNDNSDDIETKEPEKEKKTERERQTETNSDTPTAQRKHRQIERLREGKLEQTHTVYFDSGSWSLNRAAREKLAAIKVPRGAEVIVQGYTDNVGNFQYNKWLSLRRAQRVVAYLKTIHGNTSYKINALGELKPLANNQTRTGRRKNRRVVILISTSPE